MLDLLKKKLKMPVVPRTALAAGVLITVIVTVGGLQAWRMRADLKSSTKIMQGLRDEVEKLRKDNQSYIDLSVQDKSKVESLSNEVIVLREGQTASQQKEEELLAKMGEAEKAMEAQNKKAQELEKKLKEANERMRRQRNASDSLEGKARSARANPGVTTEYVKLVENEWLAANTKTEELKKDLDKTLKELAGQNQERSKLRADTATMHYNLAVILTDQGNHKAAIREYEKVIESRPEDADAHYNLAILYDDVVKDSTKALDHYRQYIRLAPASPEAPRVREWIQQKEFETVKFKH